MQNKRQEQLLAILSERRDWMTSRQLAGLLQVSDRTIRSDVEASISTRTRRPSSPMCVRDTGCARTHGLPWRQGQRQGRQTFPRPPAPAVHT